MGRAEKGMMVSNPSSWIGQAPSGRTSSFSWSRMVSKVRPGLHGADMIFLPDQAHGLPLGGLFQDEVCHQSGSRVKVQDAVGIDDQRAVTIRVKPEVDAGFLAIPSRR